MGLSACACASHAALLRESDPVRSVALLDEACVEGALDGCDAATLRADICAHEHLDTPDCRDLALQRKLGRKR